MSENPVQKALRDAEVMETTVQATVAQAVQPVAPVQQPVVKPTTHKRQRKRKNELASLIRQQIEFYLSDANLQKDRFFKQQIDQSTDGYLDLEIFLKCNKIRTLTTEMSAIVRALKKSEQLQLSEDLTQVRRVTQFSPPRNVDERTVYVECLPPSVDHDWMKRAFSGCGRVLYVSLPKYKRGGALKGFAFVEFETPEAAAKACETMNRPPPTAPEQPGIFPQASKSEKALQKQVKFRELANPGRKRRASESVLDSSSLANNNESRIRKRIRTRSVGTDDETKENRKQEQKLPSNGQNLASTEETSDLSNVQTSPLNKISEVTKLDCDKAAMVESESAEQKASAVKTESKEAKKNKRKSADKRALREARRRESEERGSENSDERAASKKDGVAENEEKEDNEDKEDKEEKEEKEDEDKEDEEGVEGLGEKEEEQAEVENLLPAESLKKKKRKQKDHSVDKEKNKKRKKDVASKEMEIASDSSPKKAAGVKAKSVKVKRRLSLDSAEEWVARKRRKKEEKATSSKAKKVTGDVTATVGTSEKREFEMVTSNERDENGKGKFEKKKKMKKVEKEKANESTKEYPAFRVISKAEWLVRRAEYLAQQKANMARLKETLKQLGGPAGGGGLGRPNNRATKEDGHENVSRSPGAVHDNPGKARSSAPEFTAGVIVKICSDVSLSRSEIKERLGGFGEIAYVDVVDGDSTAHVRCANAGIARTLSTAAVSGYRMALLEGITEEAYWHKMAADRERKLENKNKTRTKRRGKAKVLQRADLCQQTAERKKHIVFD